MLKYEEYVLESKVVELLLEKKITFEEDFQEIISILSGKGDKIAKELMSLNNADLKMNQNIISLSDNKNAINFLSSDKKITKKIIIDSGRTHSTYHDMMVIMGFQDPTGEHIFPNGTIGTVKQVIQHPADPDRMLAHFVSDVPINGVAECIINVLGLGDIEINSKPSSMNVGRFINRILTVAGITFTPKQVEDFVNKFKTEFDTIKHDVFRKFKLVSGEDIKKYYNEDSYEKPTRGSLWNSCMRYNRCGNYLDIYVKNPNKVSMLVLFDKTKDKIKGRALVWKLDNPKKDGVGRIFLDRIYVRDDADVYLFTEYAKKNGWLYKSNQNNMPEDIYGDEIKLDVELENYDFQYYPYLDTLAYKIPTEDHPILFTNYNIKNVRYIYTMRSTEGGFSRHNNF